MTEATKRPWGYVHHKGLDKHLVGATLENVAIVEDRHGNAKENADLIVKAVNAHDALVEALYTALNTETAARIGSESGAMQGFDYKYHYDKIRTALEQVK